MDSINIYKDDKYLIIVSKNHWRGLDVQVCRFGPKLVAGQGGMLTEERSPHVAWQTSISSVLEESSKGIKSASPTDFKIKVQNAIQEAKQVLGKLMELEGMADGVMNDYVHQCKKYNPEK